MKFKKRLRDTPDYTEIDENMRRLVAALNKFDGLRTIGSCGGHANSERADKTDKGAWYVLFGLERTWRG